MPCSPAGPAPALRGGRGPAPRREAARWRSPTRPRRSAGGVVRRQAGSPRHPAAPANAQPVRRAHLQREDRRAAYISYETRPEPDGKSPAHRRLRLRRRAAGAGGPHVAAVEVDASQAYNVALLAWYWRIVYELVHRIWSRRTSARCSGTRSARAHGRCPRPRAGGAQRVRPALSRPPTALSVPEQCLAAPVRSDRSAASVAPALTLAGANIDRPRRMADSLSGRQLDSRRSRRAHRPRRTPGRAVRSMSKKILIVESDTALSAPCARRSRPRASRWKRPPTARAAWSRSAAIGRTWWCSRWICPRDRTATSSAAS